MTEIYQDINYENNLSIFIKPDELISDYQTNILDMSDSEKDLSKRLDNIDKYKEILPESLHVIIDPNLNNFFFNALEEYQYLCFASLHYKFINEMIKMINQNIIFTEDDNFTTFKIDFENNEFEVITNCNYDILETVPFHIQIINSGLIFDWPDILTLDKKLELITSRYLPYELTLTCDKDNSAHSVLIVFDKLYRISYIVDSNGNLNFFDNVYDKNHSKTNPEPISYFLHRAIEKYMNLIDYTYIKLDQSTEFNLESIDTEINIRIDSDSQKKFFIGYCRGWTLLFQHILLTNNDNSFDFINYIENFCSQNKKILNEIVELYQLYYLELLNHTQYSIEFNKNLVFYKLKFNK
jgi:hypothetical protein